MNWEKSKPYHQEEQPQLLRMEGHWWFSGLSVVMVV